MILMAVKVSAAPTGDDVASTGDDTPSVDISWCQERHGGTPDAVYCGKPYDI